MAIKKRKPKKKIQGIAALRDKHAEGTIHRVVVELDEFKRLDVIGKEHSNAASRQGTALKKAYKALAKSEELKPTDEVYIDGKAWRMGVTEGEVIDVHALYQLLLDEEITEEKFLACISATKTDVKREIGADYTITLTKEVKGNTVDVRKRNLTQDEIAQHEDVTIVRKHVEKKKAKKPRTAKQSTPHEKAKRLAGNRTRHRLVKN